MSVSSQIHQSTVVIDGIPVNNLTMEEAVEFAERHVEQGKNLLVVTPNMDHFYRLRRDEEFRRAYDHAGLVLVDGSSLIWLARAQGTPLKAKISGVDFMVQFCRAAAKHGHRVFFLGGVGNVAQKSAEILERKYPGLIVAGVYAPSMGFENKPDETRAIIQEIKNSRPHVLFVGAGAPKQEKWLWRNRHELEPIVGVGVGASFDFVSGRIPRAPRWMRNAGLEWLWRLVHEPRRLFRRYIIEDLPLFLCLLAKCFFRRLRGRKNRENFDHHHSAVRTGTSPGDSAGTD